MEEVVMLKNINKHEFASAIKQSYKLMSEMSAANMARKLIQSLDSSLEPAVIAWINGEPVPDVAVDQYSINKILIIRNNCDYLEAFKLLSEYKDNPTLGEKNIWQLIHGKR